MEFAQDFCELNSAKTFLSYPCGLQWGFKILYRYRNLHLIKNHVFNNPNTGIFHGVDDICKQFQRGGKSSGYHNLITKEDLLMLYDSHMLLKNRFLARVTVNVALATIWRPEQLYSLQISDIKKVKKKDELFYYIKGIIGTTTRGSNSQQGYLSSVNDKTACVVIWRRNQQGAKFIYFGCMEK